MGSGDPSRHHELHTINYILFKSVKYIVAEYLSWREKKALYMAVNIILLNGLIFANFVPSTQTRKRFICERQSSQKTLNKLTCEIC